jgi:hypothetical protein
LTLSQYTYAGTHRWITAFRPAIALPATTAAAPTNEPPAPDRPQPPPDGAGNTRAYHAYEQQTDWITSHRQATNTAWMIMAVRERVGG